MGQGDGLLWAALGEVNSRTVPGQDLGALASGAGTDIPAGKDRSEEGPAPCSSENRMVRGQRHTN